MGPLKGRPAWNDVAAPKGLAGEPAESKPAGWAGAAYVASTETPQRSEQAGGMKSEKNNKSIIAGNVKKSKLINPPMEMGKMPRDGGKY